MGLGNRTEEGWVTEQGPGDRGGARGPEVAWMTEVSWWDTEVGLGAAEKLEHRERDQD